jgi:nucleoside-diphosphate-sugar epimerase
LKLGIGGPPHEDLILICEHSQSNLEILRGKEILIYGRTGFIGTWLTSSLLQINQEFELNIKIKVVTRNQVKAKSKYGVKSKDIYFYQHDLAIKELKNDLTADIVFIGSTPTHGATGSLNIKGILQSSKNVAKHAIAVQSQNLRKPLIIHLSSGAVFGSQPMEYLFRDETDVVVINSQDSYAQAKKIIEDSLALAYTQGLIDYQTPRLFSFLGPGLPLNSHFAIGNFMSDGMNNRKITVTGNPKTRRSYLYPTDLIEILLQILNLSTPILMNIGSDVGITVGDVAQKVSSFTSNLGVDYLDPESEPSNYVPSAINLKQHISKIIL